MKSSTVQSAIGRALSAGRTAPERAAESAISGSTFVRGIAIGALVGAAIAGSTIWERRRARQRIRRELASNGNIRAD